MARIVMARKLWENGVFVGDCATTFALNCEQIGLNGPRLGWLVPIGGCCGSTGDYQLTMQNPNPSSAAANTAAGILKGVWVEGANGSGGGALYDAATVDAVIDVCNECCDDTTNDITPSYNGTFPAVSDITDTTWTLVQADNGTQTDFMNTQLRYLGWYTEGTFKRTAYDGTNSTYTFSSSKTVPPIGTIVSLTETARTFDSNSVAAGGAGNHYSLQVVSDGTTHTLLEDDAYNTIALLVTAAQADSVLGALGTWSAFSASVIRLTSTTVNTATLVIANPAD